MLVCSLMTQKPSGSKPKVPKLLKVHTHTHRGRGCPLQCLNLLLYLSWFVVQFDEHRCLLYSVMEHNCSTDWHPCLPNSDSLFNLQFNAVEFVLVMMQLGCLLYETPLAKRSGRVACF